MIRMEVTRFAEPGDGQLGSWEGVARLTDELSSAWNAREKIRVVFTHEGENYTGEALVTQVSGSMAALKGTGPPEPA